LDMGCEHERMVLATFASVGILRAPDGSLVICLVTMDAPTDDLADRLTLLMGHGARAVLDYLAERFPRAARGQALTWRRLAANLPRSVGLATGFLPVDADIFGPNWQAAKEASLNALANDLLHAAEGFWREPSCSGLWLPRTHLVESGLARQH
jgi:hypothetical protein